jgi:hypothetical protein
MPLGCTGDEIHRGTDLVRHRVSSRVPRTDLVFRCDHGVGVQCKGAMTAERPAPVEVLVFHG